MLMVVHRLCVVFYWAKNEARKAKKLDELMAKLELSEQEAEKMATQQVQPAGIARKRGRRKE